MENNKTPLLGDTLTDLALAYLALDRPPQADLLFLEKLITAYTQKVPWESASRIVRRANTAATVDCPRWPAQFWQEAVGSGSGGTCFESNYAIFSLLLALGYDGYLTINNMGSSVGCHTAIVIQLNGRFWLVDAGLPLYTILPLDPGQPQQKNSLFHTYTVRPNGQQRYEIERDKHPMPNCFTLIDLAVGDAAYRAASTADYGADGLFLDRVIVNKVMANRAWRFNSGEKPYTLESFANGQKKSRPLGEDPAAKLSLHFAMDEGILRQALAEVS